MGQAIDVGDAATTLQQGRDAAAATFDEISKGVPTPLPAAPAPPLHHGSGPAPKSMALPPAGPTPEQTQAGGDPLIHPELTAAPPKPPTPEQKATEDNGDALNPDTFKHFVRDTFKGTGTELANVLPRVAAKWGDFLVKGGAGIVSLGDRAVEAATGKDSRMADSVFDFRKNYILPAIDYWTPQRAAVTGEGEGSGGAAQAIGGATEVVPDLFLGPAGATDIIARTGLDSIGDQIDKGQRLGSAVAIGTVDAVATFIQMKFGVIASQPLLKRVLTAIGLGDLAHVGGEVTKKLILHSEGEHEAAAKIDPMAGLDEATITNALFGAAGGHKNAGGKGASVKGDEASGSTPPEAASGDTAPPAPAAEGQTPPPPPTGLSPAPPGGTPIQLPGQPAGSVPAPIPDTPGPEGAKSLRAQIKDMNDKSTPRVGVLITPDSKAVLAGSKDVNAASVNGTVNQAIQQGRTVDLPQGTLVLKTKADAAKVRENLKNGVDPQVIVGGVTGAGDGVTGKTADKTVVVQGQTPSGAVASETTVAPENVPMAQAKMEDQGKTAVVLTPEQAQKNRMDEISTERNTPTQLGIMTTGDGKQIPVHVESGAPEGQVRVRSLDEDGEPSDHTIDVPADRVKVGAPKAGKASSEQVAAHTEGEKEVAKPAETKVVQESGQVPTDKGETKTPPVTEAAVVEPAKAEGTPTAIESRATEDTPPPSQPSREDAVYNGVTRVKKGNVSSEEANSNASKIVLPKHLSDQGYTIHYDDGVITVKDREGKTVGELAIGADAKNGKLMPQAADVSVDEAHRRKGIASAMYDAVETVTGQKVQPSGTVSGNAIALHEKRQASTSKTPKKTAEELAAEREAIKAAHAAERAPPAEPAKPKATKPKSAIESLAEALATHQDQEEVPKGKKYAAKLPERQLNAGAFGAVLRAAAVEQRGHFTPEEIKRADDAGRKAERLAEKGKEETQSGQGTGHVKVTAVVNEMHKAARILLGKAREGDEVKTVVKEAELKAKIAKKATAEAKHGPLEKVVRALVDNLPKGHELNTRLEKALPADWKKVDPDPVKAARAIDAQNEEAAKAPPEPKIEIKLNEPKEGTIIPKRAEESARKPVEKKLPEEAKREAERLADRYVYADNEDLPGVREELEQFLHEHGETAGILPSHRTPLLQLLHDERILKNPEAGGRPRKIPTMSETMEDEEHGIDTTPKGLESQGLGRNISRRGLSLADDNATLEKVKNALGLGANAFGIRMKQVINYFDRSFQSMAGNMVERGHMYDFMNRLNTGQHVGTHQLLDQMIASADSANLKGVLTSLRSKVPDAPVFLVDEVKDLRDGQGHGDRVNGMFDAKTTTIQVRIRPTAAEMLRTFVHEARHAATMYELAYNASGPLAKLFENARQILENRMRSKYGDLDIDQHLAYFNDQTGKAPVPAAYKRSIYGIANVHEIAAEMDNPKFLAEVMDSEHYASPLESSHEIPGTVRKPILTQLFEAVAKFLGFEHPALLARIGQLHEAVMSAQAHSGRTLSKWSFLAKSNEEFARDFESRMNKSFGLNPLESRKILPTMLALREEPPPLRAVDGDIRDSIDENPLRDIHDGEPTEDHGGKEITAMARAFKWATKNEVIAAVRKIKINLKTVNQIFRDHRSDFGDKYDDANPLNKLEDANIKKNVVMHQMSEITRPVAERWLKLSSEDDLKVGQLMIDTTMYHIFPHLDADSQPVEAKARVGFEARHQEYSQRFNALGEEARGVYLDAMAAAKRIRILERKAAVDTAIDSFSNGEIGDAERTHLYGAKSEKAIDELVGEGKLIDLGERNAKLANALKEFASRNELAGPYFHLGRHGEYVVQAEPEGSREFADESKANDFAEHVRSLSPNSKATVEFRGGKHVVDFKAQYVSMHETQADAEAAQQRIREAGLNPGLITKKTMGDANSPISPAMKELTAQAEAKIARNSDKNDKGVQALTDALRSAFLQMTAARSAYAGSRLARKNFAGVQAKDMRRNFAEYAQSTAWHTAQMRTVFDQASALAEVRNAARDRMANVSQPQMFRRGEVVSALNSHMQDEVQNYGHKSPLNAGIAKLGFMSYLASPAHAFIWMTQNFTTGIPRGAALYGMGKSSAGFYKGMKVVLSPAFKSTVRAVFSKGGTASDVHDAIIQAVRNDPEMSKWAKGPNSPLQQLIDRGVINHSYSNELAALAKGDSKLLARTFEWARLLPNMADAFNRVSTALAGLEMTGGDIRKTADLVEEVHANYSQENKPLLFKKLGRVPGMNSITMFKTYTQSMIHLLYGALNDTIAGKDRVTAAKTLAGLVAGNAVFVGLYGAAALEPLRLAVYAYHKIFDNEGETYDLQNQIHVWLTHHLGDTVGKAAAGGIPRALGDTLGFDLTSRMGNADLFFHNPPDMLSSDKAAWQNFIYDEAGPMGQFLADRTSEFAGHMQKGEPFQAAASLVPIKAFQDGVKAGQLLSGGKVNSWGAQMTQPSMADAAKQLFGLKPSTVAEAQEHAGVAAQMASQISKLKKDIVKDYVSSNGSEHAQARLDNYNSLHPYEPIRPNDLIKGMRFKAATEQGLPSRDQDINDAEDFH